MVLSTSGLGVALYQSQPVVRDIDIGLSEGQVCLLKGGPGCGKSILGLTLTGFLPLVAGSYQISGTASRFGRDVVQGEFDPDVSIILENPYTQLSGMKATVRGELAFPLECRGIPRSKMSDLVPTYARYFGILPLLDRQVRTLSGGELQRLIAAAAFITKPRFLFLDRPLTEIDADFRPVLLALLKKHLETVHGAAMIAEDPWLYDPSEADCVVELGGDEMGTAAMGNPRDIAASGPSCLDVEGISFSYDGVPVIDDLSFSLPAGGLMRIHGPNGAGKTTLARLVCGLLTPQSGTIVVDGRDVGDMPEWERFSMVGYALQDAGLQLCRRTVREELELASQWGHPADEVAEILGLAEVLECHPLELSRAGKKRLSIALAAGRGRKLLILDEPTQYQDTAGFNRIVDVVVYCMNRGMGVLIITHDQRLTDAFPDTGVIRLAQADSA